MGQLPFDSSGRDVMNMLSYQRIQRAVALPALVLIGSLNFTACATARMSMRYGELNTQTEMSESVFLDLRSELPPTVYLSENSTAGRDVTVWPALDWYLTKSGYSLVESPNEATYVLQINHLRTAKVELSGDETVADALNASLMAGAGSALAAEVLGAGKAAGEIGLVVGIVAFIVDAKTKHMAHTLTTDVLVTETVPGGEGGNELRYHATEITSGASKVNLEWHESMPTMVRA